MAVMDRVRGGKMFPCGLVVLALVVSSFANPTDTGCDSVKRGLELRGLQRKVLSMPQNGPICGEDSCCGEGLENELMEYSQSSLEKYVKDSVIRTASILESRAKKFDETFRSMMESSKREFHEMFEKTYGKIYLQNADVFSDFFSELETYYKKGTVRLSETMDNFFGILYQRMFTVLNAQYSFDENYMVCVSNHMLEMKPFGDVPHKLTQQLKRALVATRTFYKNLMRAVELLREVANTHIEEECAHHLARMQMCGVCRYGDENGSVACSSYCTDTLNLCLRNYVQLNDPWDNFVASIEKVGGRLTGPYNVVSVVEPLNIKISEAVMNFQEVGTEVSKKIQGKCGQLVLKRQTRAADYDLSSEDNPNLEVSQENVKFGQGKKKQKKGQQEDMPSLEKIIKDIENRVKNTKQFWNHLPYQYCNNSTVSLAPSYDGSCWNGTAISSYEKQSTKPAPTMNPLFTGTAYSFTTLTEKLRKAYVGEDVEIIDDTEEVFEGSGSGSGDDEDGDDDDEREDEDVAPSGGDADQDIVFRKNPEPSTPPPLGGNSQQPEVVLVNTSGASRRSSMSLTRALIQYLLPIVMVWFGGAIRELL